MKTKLPPLSSGVRYCTMPDGSKHCTGSQMGRPDSFPDNFDRIKATPKLRLYRLPWSDGDYDSGGAYWGRSPGSAIYRAVAVLPCPPALWFGHVEMFVRASSRTDAKAQVRKTVPNARFFT